LERKLSLSATVVVRLWRASHVTVDFTKAAGIRAINFNEADLITCFANDYGYENWVAQALEAYADQGELLILISSSGNSQNILNGAKKAKEMGLLVITLSGFLPDNPLRELGNLNLWVDSTEYNIVEMTHHVWLVAIIDYLIETKGFLK
jgi:D-sedoheptulose 7-phosphate isomerase